MSKKEFSKDFLESRMIDNFNRLKNIIRTENKINKQIDFNWKKDKRLIASRKCP